jgi:hypothetical protein
VSFDRARLPPSQDDRMARQMPRPVLGPRLVEKSREKWSPGSHQCPRGDGRHGCQRGFGPRCRRRVLRPAGFHRRRRTGRGPPSMPRAELVTALPTRQGSTCYEKLRSSKPLDVRFVIRPPASTALDKPRGLWDLVDVVTENNLIQAIVTWMSPMPFPFAETVALTQLPHW